ncbi:MAG TPA: HEAT repeat domain-containing protein [Thermoanaerobaculia bacterium]|nr:HEAT repeat domain-containing protein [Thermoanaerobaculia bacterium]
MIRRTVLLCALFVLCAARPGLTAAAVFDSGWADAGEGTREDQLYEQGTRALDDGDWDQAAAAFTEVARSDSARADAALYWVAYAYKQEKRHAEALALLGEFPARFPKSSWLKDVRALELEIRQSAGGKVRPEVENDEDLKLMAINSLLNTDPERAIPLLEKLLKSGSSSKIRERALFVLAQSDTPRARQIVGDIARSNSDPELQDKALHYLGIHGGRASRELLAEIYASPSSTLEVRERILKSYMIAGERDRILAAAKTEKDPRLRSAAVRLLGVMGARSELWQLYRSETSFDVKRTALQAMFVAGDSGHVLELARTESQPELKREAIHKLGTMDRQQAGPALVSIYKSEKDPDLRKAALQGLFVQGNSNALVEIARSEKDPELKREAVRKLSVMGRDKEATDYLMELLKD